jgi:hypothetical protein
MTEKELKGLFGGGEADDTPPATDPAEAERGGRGRRRGGGRRGGGRRRRSPEERAQQQDFINRYTSGNPTEGFSSEEAIGYLQQLRGEAPPEVMQRAAVETVRHLPDEQRKQFAEMLQRRQAGTGMVTIERTGEARATSAPTPSGRASPASDPFGDLLGGLLGGGAAAPEPDPRQQQPQEQGGGIGDMLGSPLGKAVLGGIAAYAMKEMMDQDDQA